MGVPNLTPIRDSFHERIIQLEAKHNREKERNRGDGSTPAVWRTVEPNIRKEVVESCLGDIDGIENMDELLRVLAEWRRNLDQDWAFKTNNSTVENERNSIKKAEIRGFVDDLIDLIPDSEFNSCGICGSTKMPKSDRRRKIGYRWECPDCY